MEMIQRLKQPTPSWEAARKVLAFCFPFVFRVFVSGLAARLQLYRGSDKSELINDSILRVGLSLTSLGDFLMRIWDFRSSDEAEQC